MFRSDLECRPGAVHAAVECARGCSIREDRGDGFVPGVSGGEGDAGARVGGDVGAGSYKVWLDAEVYAGGVCTGEGESGENECDDGLGIEAHG